MEGWELRRLGDLCAFDKTQGIHTNLPYVGLEHIESGTSQFLGSIEPTDVKSSTFKFNNSHVLYGRLRPYLNKVLLPDFEGHCSTEIFPIQVKPGLLREYLCHWLMSESVVESINATCTGARMPRADMNEVLNFNIPVPSEQRQHRIVTLLDEAFADIATAKANAEKNLQNARELFNSHLDAIVVHAQENGEIVALSELATDITDGDHMPPPKVEQGLPFITIGNIDKQTRSIDFSDTFKVPREYFDGLKANKKPMRGDVLYTVTGSFGIPVLVEDDTEFCFQRHIGLIRPKADVDSTWLHYLLQSPQAFNQAADGATGTAQKTVSLKVLRNLQVPRISPKDQLAHVETLRSVEAECRRLESIYRQKLSALDDLKKSLLHQAFSGQL